jgi:hypothetical protein
VTTILIDETLQARVCSVKEFLTPHKTGLLATLPRLTRPEWRGILAASELPYPVCAIVVRARPDNSQEIVNTKLLRF